MFTEPIETSSMNYVIMESLINKDFIDLINKEVDIYCLVRAKILLQED